MKNPWLKLPKKKPYILKIDLCVIKEYNNKANSSNRIRQNLLPEPFLGNPKSPIILLNLNPGWDRRDNSFHRQRQFRRVNRANLLHKKTEYPFYLLNPKLSASLGYKWWYKRLHELIENFGCRTVAQKICCLEFAPYHSQTFKQFNSPLLSQKYDFHLLKQALKNNALIIIMRSSKYWQRAVPELKKYKNKYRLKSWRNPCLTKANLRYQAYKKLTRILREN
ncbi:MAG: hypothetical protein NTW93_01880 [Phycisphaerae bacterium]|nr:hypothetical protein [Phycisphaerae bacterium]